MYSMIMANMLSASGSAYRLNLKEDMLGCVDQGVQDSRGKNAGRLLKDLAVGESRDRRHYRVPPVGERTRAIIQMRASENDGRQQEGSICKSQLVHDRILEEGAEQDLLRKSRGGED